METRLALRLNAIEQLRERDRVDHNNTNQYSRRMCLRVNGVEAPIDRSKEDCKSTLKKCYDGIGLHFPADEIDRVHLIGRKYVTDKTKKEIQPLIVKFKSWDTRTEFFTTRPRAYSGGKKNGRCRLLARSTWPLVATSCSRRWTRGKRSFLQLNLHSLMWTVTWQFV